MAAAKTVSARSKDEHSSRWPSQMPDRCDGVYFAEVTARWAITLITCAR
jgi:hypothetical protein